MNQKFWSNKKVLITGHTGFKGSWLSLWLQRAGAQVVGYALEPPTNPSLFESARIGEGMKSIIGDVRDAAFLTKTVEEEKPDILFHLAAQSIVRASYNDPVGTYATNVLGTVHMLEAVRKSTSVRVVVNVTSDKCYENKEWQRPYRETDPMGGYDPYSSSKGCAELVTSAYRNSFFNIEERTVASVGLASVRAGNVLGGGDWTEDQLVPDIIRAFSDRRPVLIRSPHAVRPWQFVLDPLNGYLRVAEKIWEEGSVFADAWNFGPAESDMKPVSWIADYLAQLWGGEARWIYDGRPRPHEANYLKLDSTKASTLLDWSPKVGLQKTLEWIVEWYKCYRRDGDARPFTEMQLSQYEQAD